MPTGVPKSGKRKCGPRVERVAFVCVWCKGVRMLEPSRARQLKGGHCSKRCAGAHRTAIAGHKVKLVCPECGVDFEKRKDHLRKSGHNYCSKACAVVGWQKRRLERIYPGEGRTIGKWKDPEHIKQYFREYTDRNREKINRRSSEWGKRNRDKRTMNARLRRAAGNLKLKQWKAICAKCDYRCVACLRYLPLTLDHVKAVSKGGLTDRDNVQPLCRCCNQRKQTKQIDYRETFKDRLQPSLPLYPEE